MDFCIREDGWRGHLVILFPVCDWPRESVYEKPNRQGTSVVALVGPRTKEGFPRDPVSWFCGVARRLTVCRRQGRLCGKEDPKGEGRTHSAVQRHFTTSLGSCCPSTMIKFPFHPILCLPEIPTTDSPSCIYIHSYLNTLFKDILH